MCRPSIQRLAEWKSRQRRRRTLVHRHLSTGDRFRLGSTDVRVLFSEQQIQERVRALSDKIREGLPGSVPVFIGLLSGSFVFLSDLIRAYGEDHEIDFLKVSRYDRMHKDPTAVRMMHDLRSDIRDRDVVVVEGIRARGNKIQYVDKFLKLHQPRSLQYCAMIEPAEAQLTVPLDESGFRIDNEFVVGYGLDYKEQYRNLAFIGALESVTPGIAPGAEDPS